MSTIEYPFADDSLWNCRPINPKFGTFMIPPTCSPRGSDIRTYGRIESGALSTGVFTANENDPPVTLYKPNGSLGIVHADYADFVNQVTLPHWPSSAIPASGDDGHCEVFDPTTREIHSLWGARVDVNGRWTAKAYAHSHVDGHGWGDPAHYYQGARASGVPTCAGLIRKHEVNSNFNQPFWHVLAMSLDCSGLNSSPSYVAPATASDVKEMMNTGQIPEGALMMLPNSFDLNRLNRWPNLRKLANTLQVYGARVVDRTNEVPFAIYMETGTDWSLRSTAPEADFLAEMDYIRTQLRQVVSQDGFYNKVSKIRVAPVNENIMSMRGAWSTGAGFSVKASDIFDTYNQRISLPETLVESYWMNKAQAGFKVKEFKPVPGEYFKITITSNCSAQFRLVFETMVNGVATNVLDSWYKGSGTELYIKWPSGGWYTTFIRKQPCASGWIKTHMVKVGEADFQAATTKMSIV